MTGTKKSRRGAPLGAATDDPDALASRAIDKTEEAIRAHDPVSVREGANLSWLAVSSLADVTADRLELPAPGGSSGRREVLSKLEALAKLRRGSLVNRFESARTVLHGECFHGDECPRDEILLDMMHDLRDSVRDGLNAIPKAVRSLRRTKRGRRGFHAGREDHPMSKKQVGSAGGEGGAKTGVRRRLVVTTESGQAPDEGRMDTGADRTILTAEVACKVGAGKHAKGWLEMRVPGGATLVGVEYPVTVNLIGDDFFRGSRSKLDYGRPGREFSGLGRQGKWRRTSRERARYGQRLLAEMCKR